MNLLHLDSSILGPNSASRRLSSNIVDRLTAGHTDATVTYRDLAADPLSHLSGSLLMAAQAGEVEHAPELAADIAGGAAALHEFLAADTVVIGVAFYNFTIPTQLKAWVDRILVAGQTFRYGANGMPEGLAGNKRVILAITRGGQYGPGSPTHAYEHAESYLRTVLGFIGIYQPEVISADGMAIGPEQREASLAEAEQQAALLTT